MTSEKLDLTLQELEGAFSDWESLASTSQSSGRDCKDEYGKKRSNNALQSEEEFRKKTKKLLSQLREQLAELTE